MKADTGPVLDARALNRAFLARQLLLQRQTTPVHTVIQHLVGMQAQEPRDPYVALWSRLEHFDPDELSGLITERQVVRLALLRSTIHLVTADDCLALRPLLQPVLERTLRGSFGKHLVGLDLEVVVAAGRQLLAGQSLMLHEIGRRLKEQWPDRDAEALAQVIRARLALVQVPPRGLWRASGQARHAIAEDWLGRAGRNPITGDELVLRYLAAFGPATTKDIQTWSGLTRLAEVMERLRSQLVTFRDRNNRELFDLPDAPRPRPDTPAPPRFLPEYDNAFLAHADRSRLVADHHRPSFPSETRLRFVLIDGFMRATWSLTRERNSATLIIEPIERLSRQERALLEEEATAFLTVFAAHATARDIRIG